MASVAKPSPPRAVIASVAKQSPHHAVMASAALATSVAWWKPSPAHLPDRLGDGFVVAPLLLAMTYATLLAMTWLQELFK